MMFVMMIIPMMVAVAFLLLRLNGINESSNTQKDSIDETDNHNGHSCYPIGQVG